MSGGGASEAPGGEEGTRARSRSKGSDQRTPGASSTRPPRAATNAPERLARRRGESGPPDPTLDPVGVQDQVTNAGFCCFSVSGRAHCGGEDEEVEEEGFWMNVTRQRFNKRNVMGRLVLL